jgi:hypothetical protein
MQLRAVPAGSTDFENPMSNVKREVLSGLRLNSLLSGRETNVPNSSTPFESMISAKRGPLLIGVEM